MIFDAQIFLDLWLGENRILMGLTPEVINGPANELRSVLFHEIVHMHQLDALGRNFIGVEKTIMEIIATEATLSNQSSLGFGDAFARDSRQALKNYYNQLP